MGLSQALAAAVSGLHANQAGLSIVAGNVANANTPGYVRKTVNQIATADAGTTIGVRIGDVQRQLDQYVQKQLRARECRRGIRRPARAVLRTAPGNLRPARLQYVAERDIQ